MEPVRRGVRHEVQLVSCRRVLLLLLDARATTDAESGTSGELNEIYSLEEEYLCVCVTVCISTRPQLHEY